MIKTHGTCEFREQIETETLQSIFFCNGEDIGWQLTHFSLRKAEDQLEKVLHVVFNMHINFSLLCLSFVSAIWELFAAGFSFARSHICTISAVTLVKWNTYVT